MEVAKGVADGVFISNYPIDQLFLLSVEKVQWEDAGQHLLPWPQEHSQMSSHPQGSKSSSMVTS